MSSNDNSTRIPGLINSNTNLLQINEAVRSGRDHLEEMVRSRDLEIQTLRREVESLRRANQTIDLKDLEIAEFQDSTNSWLQKDEAFKRLLRRYGNSIGVTDLERNIDFNTIIVEISQEDPKFSNTGLTANAKKYLKEIADKSE